MSKRESSSIALHNDILRFVVDPTDGAKVMEFSGVINGQRRDLFVPATEIYPACFAMLPFVSRLRRGRLVVDQATHELPPNVMGEPHPIHGYGWLVDWVVQHRTSTELLLTRDFAHSDWPYHFAARLRYALSGSRLDVNIAVENLDERPMPFSLGLHPFVSKTPLTRVRADISHEWTMDEGHFPISKARTAKDFPNGLAMIEEDLDSVFSHWVEPIQIQWPEWQAGMRIDAPDCDHLVLWSPVGESFFGCEPISQVPGEFASLGSGAVALQSIRFDLETL